MQKNTFRLPKAPAISHFAPQKHPPVAQPQPEPSQPIPNPLGRNKVLLSWEAYDYEKKERTPRWLAVSFLLIVALIAYALFTDNLLMGVLFILIGVSFYIFENKSPKKFKFQLTTDGVIAHDDLYEYSSLSSFWLHYEPYGWKVLSLKSKRKYLPSRHLPLGTANPVQVRKILLQFLPEIKEEEGLTDAVEKILY